MSLQAQESSGAPGEAMDWVATDAVRGGGGTAQFVSFAIGEDQYGVDIMSVREIRGWTNIKHLPKQPDFVRGVLNLRGAIVPIIDLRCRFGAGLTETTMLNIIIIVQMGGRQVGLIGDRVLDIVSADVSQIQPVPRTSRDADADFLSGLIVIEGTMIAVISLNEILLDGEAMSPDVMRGAAS